MTLRDTQANPAYLPIGEAARQLGVSADTLRRWEREGRIEAIRTLGNQRRYRQSDIDALTSPSSAMPSPEGYPPAGEGDSSLNRIQEV